VSEVALFVYGSLKRGFRNHSVMGAAAFVREAQTAPGYRLVLQGEYPALTIERGGKGSVSGELYLVHEAELPRLDAFEDVPTLYQREHVLLDDGTTAQAYVIAAALAARSLPVPGGCWLEPR
jgi:gamma-glutamylcyclotransferase (GGCT)/AIG2-like uncharacterized protein YtfP